MIKREPYEKQFLKLMAKGMKILIEKRERELEVKEQETKKVSIDDKDS